MKRYAIVKEIEKHLLLELIINADILEYYAENDTQLIILIRTALDENCIQYDVDALETINDLPNVGLDADNIDVLRCNDNSIIIRAYSTTSTLRLHKKSDL